MKLVHSRVTVRQWMVLELNGVMWIIFQVPVKTWCLQTDSPTTPGLMKLVLLPLKVVLFAQLWNMSMLLWLLPLLTMSMPLWLLPLLIMSIFLLQNMSMSLLLSPLLPMFILLDNIIQRFLKDSMLPSLRLLVWKLLQNKISITIINLNIHWSEA